MSFSIHASGPKSAVTANLEYQTVNGTFGAGVLRLLAEVMRDAPDTVDGRPLTYTVTASGHANKSGYSSPYLSASITAAAAEPKPAEQTPAPADATAGD